MPRTSREITEGMQVEPYDDRHAASAGELLRELRWYDDVFDEHGRRDLPRVPIAYVAVVEGSVVGYIDGAVGPTNPAYAQPNYPSSTQSFVCFIGTAHTHRGLGVGRALLRAFAQDVERRGFPYVTLAVASGDGDLGWRPDDVRPGIDSAEAARVAFFEACGFELLDTGLNYDVMGAPVSRLLRGVAL